MIFKYILSLQVFSIDILCLILSGKLIIQIIILVNCCGIVSYDALWIIWYQCLISYKLWTILFIFILRILLKHTSVIIEPGITWSTIMIVFNYRVRNIVVISIKIFILFIVFLIRGLIISSSLIQWVILGWAIMVCLLIYTHLVIILGIVALWVFTVHNICFMNLT